MKRKNPRAAVDATVQAPFCTSWADAFRICAVHARNAVGVPVRLVKHLRRKTTKNPMLMFLALCYGICGCTRPSGLPSRFPSTARVSFTETTHAKRPPSPLLFQSGPRCIVPKSPAGRNMTVMWQTLTYNWDDVNRMESSTSADTWNLQRTPPVKTNTTALSIANRPRDFQDGLPRLLDLRFSDDILIFGQAVVEAARLLNELVRCCSQAGLFSNAIKTQSPHRRATSCKAYD